MTDHDPKTGRSLGHLKMPLLMGPLMGAIMLWMLHGFLTGESTLSGPALAVFIGAHVAVLVVVLGAGLFAARLSPRVRNWMARVHRPSWRHMGAMMGSAVASAAVVHVIVHGGL